VSKPGRADGGDGAALTDGDILRIAGPKVERSGQHAAPPCRINPIANSATADYSGDAMPIGTCDSFWSAKPEGPVMDIAITQWINGFAGQNPLVDQMMIAITKFGVPAMIIYVVLQWWSRNDRLFVRHVAICAGLGFLLGLAINQGILVFVHRLRPYCGRIRDPETSASRRGAFDNGDTNRHFAGLCRDALRHRCVGRRGNGYRRGPGGLPDLSPRQPP
jgi:hypothetical protein